MATSQLETSPNRSILVAINTAATSDHIVRIVQETRGVKGVSAYWLDGPAASRSANGGQDILRVIRKIHSEKGPQSVFYCPDNLRNLGFPRDFVGFCNDNGIDALALIAPNLSSNLPFSWVDAAQKQDLRVIIGNHYAGQNSTRTDEDSLDSEEFAIYKRAAEAGVRDFLIPTSVDIGEYNFLLKMLLKRQSFETFFRRELDTNQKGFRVKNRINFAGMRMIVGSSITEAEHRSTAAEKVAAQIR